MADIIRCLCCMFVWKRHKFCLLTYSVFGFVLFIVLTHEPCRERVLAPLDANSTFNTNPYNLTFVINEPDTCRNKPDLFIITTVSSSPDHFEFRSTIRRTWGGNFSYDRVKLKTLFFVGLTTDKNVMSRIETESEQFHDVIQADFVDSYRNMTYKFTAELQWVHRHCSRVKFVVKTDDDVFVDVFRLNEYLRNEMTDANKIACSLVKNAMPYRTTGRKWHVRNDEYECKRYPIYCSGGAVIVPKVLTGTLLDGISRTEFFWIDDVYITGILPKILKIRHVQLGSLEQMFPDEIDENTIKEVTEGNILFLHAASWKSLTVLPLIWEELIKTFH